MTSNVSARAATVGELAKFRAGGQWSKLGLVIQQPETVYTARINDTFASVDGVVEFIYDGGSGTLADVKVGMTIFVGTAAGLYDKGICRVRQAPSATDIYIGQTSDIQFADNDYITIVNSFSLWQRDLARAGELVLMDYDISFGDLDNGGVIPRIGPMAAVLKLVAGTVTFAPPDPSLSECYDGATIVSYLYDAPGAASTADMGTTSPSWTYDTAGEYRWSCTITDSLGRETVSYRWVFVDPTPVSFNLESCGADYGDGDWSFEVTCFAGVTRADVHDRALVTLYAEREVYNGVTGSVGKMAGFENVLACGWIDGESIVYDRESGEVNFTVRGAGFWLSKLRTYPLELQDTSTTATGWKEIEEMTVDKALAQILYWRSTAALVMDCFFTGDTTRHKIFAEPGGFLKDQLDAVANRIFAKPLVNSYGQLFVEVDAQIIADAARDALPVVMDITKPDWISPLEVERVTTPKTAMVELGAVSDYDGATSSPIYSRAPGLSGKAHGQINSYNNYVIVDQDECNRIAGCLLAVENNEYEPLEINLSANNRLLDIAPRMYCTISIAEADTTRGIVISGARLIPRKVELEWDKESFSLATVVTFEFEAIGVDGVEYNPPTVTDDNVDMSIDMDGVDFPGMDDWFPPTNPPGVDTPCSAFVHNSFTLTWSPSVITGAGPLISKAYFPCMLRATGSSIIIPIVFYADAAAHFAVYGVKDGARVITGTLTVGRPTVVNFTPASNLQVDGFEIEIDELLTGTIWDQTAGIDPFSSTDAYNLILSVDFPTAKQVHFKTDQPPDTPYDHQTTGVIGLSTPAVGGVAVTLSYSVLYLGLPNDPASHTFEITGTDVTATTLMSGIYGSTDLSAVNVLYNGDVGSLLFFTYKFDPNVYGRRRYEIWITIHDTATDRAIHLSNSTLYDVCAI